MKAANGAAVSFVYWGKARGYKVPSPCVLCHHPRLGRRGTPEASEKDVTSDPIPPTSLVPSQPRHPTGPSNPQIEREASDRAILAWFK